MQYLFRILVSSKSPGLGADAMSQSNIPANYSSPQPEQILILSLKCFE